MAGFITLRGDYGAYKGSVWRKEAKLQFNSYRKLRISSEEEAEELKKYKDNFKTSHARVDELITNIYSYRKSSILLLCYAVELGLKSSMLPLLLNMPKNNSMAKIKRFSHDYLRISKFIGMKLSESEAECLSYLSDYVRSYGRYPFEAENSQASIFLANQLNSKISDSLFVSQVEGLFGRIYEYSKSVQGTSECPASHSIFCVENMIIVFREAGLASPRLTVHAPNISGEIDVNHICKALERCDESSASLIKDRICHMNIERTYKV